MGRVLNQTVLAGGKVWPAGTAEADIDAKVEDKFWTTSSSRSKAKTATDPEAPSTGEGETGPADAETETENYGDQKVDELEAEIESRNKGRADDEQIVVTGTGKDERVLKKDLIAALEADDAR